MLAQKPPACLSRETAQNRSGISGCRRGVLLSAGLFGALHNSGGRNPAFAVWSGAVGALYGAAFLYTKDVYVPMAAHSLANVASGLLWFRTREQLS